MNKIKLGVKFCVISHKSFPAFNFEDTHRRERDNEWDLYNIIINSDNSSINNVNAKHTGLNILSAY